MHTSAKYYTEKPVVYFDWSLHRGVLALFGEHGLDYKIYLHLPALLDDLKEPHRIIGEMTFDSFNLDRRSEVIDRAAKDGHELLCVPTRQTTKSRHRAGFSDKSPNTLESDIEDAQSIRLQVQRGGALRPPGTPPDFEYKRVYEAVASELMRLRSTGEFSFNRNGNPKFISDKTLVPAMLEQHLPDVNSLSENIQQALGSSEMRKGGHKGYNATMLAAVAVLAKHCPNRRMFDRVSGLHTHAYGSQVRSDLMFWVWAGGNNRGKIYTKGDVGTHPGNYGDRKDGLTLTEYRRSLRWLYHQIRELLASGTVKY